MLSMFIVLTIADATPQTTHKCATLERLRLSPVTVTNADIPVRPPNSNKSQRDSVCGGCNTLSSDNFIVRWGNGISQDQAQNVLDSFEYAWEIEINQLNYEIPTAADTYLFNVYIGDTGGGAPQGYGAAGYFTGDNQGYPMIVIAKQTIMDEGYLDFTVAHEFFHALQGRTNRYDYDPYGPGAWYWEATANWVETEVYPGQSGNAGFLIGYTFFPHYPVNFFDYPDEGTLQEYHQYGAFIFPQHLTEIEADAELIRSSWQDTSSDNDPMNVLNSYLEPFGTTIEEAWLHHIARMTVMDYSMGDLYEEYLGYYSGYPESENRYAETVMQQGSMGWRRAPAETRPQRFGHNTIIARGLTEDAMTFSVRGDDTGSEGNTAIFGATITKVRNGDVTYHPLEFEGNDGEATLRGIRSSDTYYLSIGAWSSFWDPSHIYSETYDYEYNIGPAEGIVSEPSAEPSGEPSSELVPGFNENDELKAGCSSVSSIDTWWFGLVGMIGLARRRD